MKTQLLLDAFWNHTLEDRRNYMYDLEHTHGSGLHKSPSFPQETIFRDTFDRVKAAMDQWKPGLPSPPGWEINFGATGGKNYSSHKELRKYVVVPTTTVPWWKKLVSAEKLRNVGVKLFLYLANHTNAQFEWADWGQDKVYPEVTERTVPDKCLQNISLLFLGIPPIAVQDKNDGVEAEAVVLHHQPLHNIRNVNL